MRPYPFFVDDANRVVEDTSQRPMVAPIWYPPEHWQPGEVIATETVPWDLGDSFYPSVGVLWGTDWAMPSQRVPVTAVTSSELVRLFDGDTWVRLLRFERQNGRAPRNTGDPFLRRRPTWTTQLESRFWTPGHANRSGCRVAREPAARRSCSGERKPGLTGTTPSLSTSSGRTARVLSQHDGMPRDNGSAYIRLVRG